MRGGWCSSADRRMGCGETGSRVTGAPFGIVRLGAGLGVASRGRPGLGRVARAQRRREIRRRSRSTSSTRHLELVSTWTTSWGSLTNRSCELRDVHQTVLVHADIRRRRRRRWTLVTTPLEAIPGAADYVEGHHVLAEPWAVDRSCEGPVRACAASSRYPAGSARTAHRRHSVCMSIRSTRSWFPTSAVRSTVRSLAMALDELRSAPGERPTHRGGGCPLARARTRRCSTRAADRAWNTFSSSLRDRTDRSLAMPPRAGRSAGTPIRSHPGQSGALRRVQLHAHLVSRSLSTTSSSLRCRRG